jgi:hypothetical protein
MRRFAFSLALSVLCAAGADLAQAETQLPTTADILGGIQRIKVEKDKNLRIQLSHDILDGVSEVWRAQAMDNLDDKVIDELMPLLDDDSDIVRGWTACTIGYFGPRARRAVPALYSAMTPLREERERRRLVIAPAVDSSAFIEVALERVQGVSDNKIFPELQSRGP